MIFMDKKKRDIVFDDTRTREEFFQTVSQIKHIHKSEKDVKNVSVSFVCVCVRAFVCVRACMWACLRVCLLAFMWVSTRARCNIIEILQILVNVKCDAVSAPHCAL